MSASMLVLLDYCDAIKTGGGLNPKDGRRKKLIEVDIDIRAHNRAAIDAHPLRNKIHTIEGSSIAHNTMEQVAAQARRLRARHGVPEGLPIIPTNMCSVELELYAPYVSKGSYCVVSGIPESRTCPK